MACKALTVSWALVVGLPAAYGVCQNLYDNSPGVSGTCAGFISAGMSCAGYFSYGQQYFGYCDQVCGYGECHTQCEDETGVNCTSMLLSGSYTCQAHFDHTSTSTWAGRCDLSCGFGQCVPAASCRNLYDISSVAQQQQNSCAHLLAGAFTCADHFSAGRAYAGYCDQECGFCSTGYHVGPMGCHGGYAPVHDVATCQIAAGATGSPSNVSAIDNNTFASGCSVSNGLSYFNDGVSVTTSAHGNSNYSWSTSHYAICQHLDLVPPATTQVVSPCTDAGGAAGTVYCRATMTTQCFNWLDTGNNSATCAQAIAATPNACVDLFAPGRQYAGYCDQSCSFNACNQSGWQPKSCAADYCASCPDAGVCDASCDGLLNNTIADGSYDDPCSTNCSVSVSQVQSIQDIHFGAGRCASLVANGLSCDMFFAPGQQYAGQCDAFCGYTQRLSCAEMSALSWYYSCPFLMLGGSVGNSAWNSSCTTCATCLGSVPASLNADAACLSGLLVVAQDAATACLTANNTFDCGSSNCTIAVQALESHLGSCVHVNWTSYGQDVATYVNLASMYSIQCHPNSCVRHYNDVATTCVNSSGAVCDGPTGAACQVALNTAASNASACLHLASLPDFTTGWTHSEWAAQLTAVANEHSIQCAGCAQPRFDQLCFPSGSIGFTCTPGDSCAQAHAPFYYSLLDPTSGCNATYTAAFGADWFANFTQSNLYMHLTCTGQNSNIFSGTGPASVDATHCLNVHAQAISACASSGGITSPSICANASCTAAVHHLVAIHDECWAAHQQVQQYWPLENSTFQVLQSVSMCPCMDHDLSQYAMANTSSTIFGTTCQEIAARGQCQLDLGAFSPVLVGQSAGTRMCCMSCQQGGTTVCQDMALCSPHSPISFLVNLPSMCSLPVNGLLPNQLIGNSFSQACPVTCGSCLSYDECSSSPCQNSGTCIDLNGAYQCVCASGHFGNECQNSAQPPCDVTTCAVSHAVGQQLHNETGTSRVWTAASFAAHCSVVDTRSQGLNSGELACGWAGCCCATHPNACFGGLAQPPAITICAFDVYPPYSGDGRVDASDLLLMLSLFGSSSTVLPLCDLDADGSIGVGDILLLFSAYGTC